MATCFILLVMMAMVTLTSQASNHGGERASQEGVGRIGTSELASSKAPSEALKKLSALVSKMETAEATRRQRPEDTVDSDDIVFVDEKTTATRRATHEAGDTPMPLLIPPCNCDRFESNAVHGDFCRKRTDGENVCKDAQGGCPSDMTFCQQSPGTAPPIELPWINPNIPDEEPLPPDQWPQRPIPDPEGNGNGPLPSPSPNAIADGDGFTFIDPEVDTRKRNRPQADERIKFVNADMLVNMQSNSEQGPPTSSAFVQVLADELGTAANAISLQTETLAATSLKLYVTVSLEASAGTASSVQDALEELTSLSVSNSVFTILETTFLPNSAPLVCSQEAEGLKADIHHLIKRLVAIKNEELVLMEEMMSQALLGADTCQCRPIEVLANAMGA